MSGIDARTRLEKGEKAILTEIMHLYKKSPCLWDQKHEQYGDRIARNQAYEVLLDKYKLIQSDASIVDVKKKIEYLRCAYRREHKRVSWICNILNLASIYIHFIVLYLMFFFQVLEAHCRGIVHSPTLWYYDLLKFLNDYRPEDNSVKIEYYEVLILLRKYYEEIKC